ncbi:Yip1 family protein [Asticcacaulis sp. SL142]|uniref:Yip1 family protein n=1 Tax=Asticcacaulis sp. SL142 TaxID=2995155 RepID=UPI00226D1BFB|nr:Yip1 family protein [Asticcacaulis sp. SL142]WAC47771.1 Yip1 family protein [Asticcacaulis sp. SL142]
MNTVEDNDTAATSLVARIRNILLQPSVEWDKIAQETTTAKEVFSRYVLILAAIPALATLIGSQIFGVNAFLFSVKPPLWQSVMTAVLVYGLSLVSVWVLSLVINALTPTFQGEKNPAQAYKVAAYSNTPGWLAGIFSLIPHLGVLGLLGLYGIYLLYRGLPRLMKSPVEKSTTFTLAVVVVGIVVNLVLFAVVAPVMGLVSGAGANIAANAPSEVTINGKTVDVTGLEAAARKMEDAAEKMQNAEAVKVVDPNVLEGLMPAMVAGAARGEVTTSANSAGQYSGSSAEAQYLIEDGNLNVKVTDIGAMGAMAALGTAMNVNSSRKVGESYEKITTENGRLVSESYDADTKHGKYSVLVAERILIEAEGDNVEMATLKSAVDAVGFTRAEKLIQ